MTAMDSRGRCYHNRSSIDERAYDGSTSEANHTKSGDPAGAARTQHKQLYECTTRHSLTETACVARAAGALDSVEFDCSAPDCVDVGRSDPDSVYFVCRAPLTLVAQRHGPSNRDAATSA